MPVRSVCLVSRQRLVGATNGSSNYILSIARFLSENGLAVHYLCPTPTVFGRWPFLWLRRDLDVLASYRIRGGWKIGRLVINPSLAALWHAGLAVTDILIAKLGLRIPRLGKEPGNPFLEFWPLTEADVAYLRAQGRPLADAVLCDYAMMTPAIADLAPDTAPSAVVMHDLYSANYPGVDRAKEFDLLSRAGAIVAIQAEEAAKVKLELPDAKIILAPMAMQPAPAAIPGDALRLLFVASRTGPNIEALNWFAESVWPILAKARPDLVVDVVGTVSRGVGPMPPGIQLHGLVADVTSFYRTDGIVISPLRSGTGLKIKLIEAMGFGKAIVATSVTAQGVEDAVKDAVVIADEPRDFANAVLALVDSDEERSALGTAGLALIRRDFAPQRCYGEILAHLTGVDAHALSTIEASPAALP